MNGSAFRFPILFAILVVISWNSCPSLLAQPKAEPGESVRILDWQGAWRDGVVLEREGRHYFVEFSNFMDRTDRKIFERSQLRRENEFEAIDYGRTWQSANKAFTIKAALKGVENDEAILIKEDLDEIRVPLEKLSTKDKNYCKKIVKTHKNGVMRGSIPDKTPPLPEVENFGAAPLNLSGIALTQKSTPLAPTPTYMKFSEMGVAFNRFRDSQNLTAIIPVGGPDELVLVTGRERSIRNAAKWQSQGYWLSLKKKKVTGWLSLTASHYPLDYDPRYKRLLTLYSQPFERDNVFFTLWDLEIGAESAKPIVSWSTKDPRGLDQDRFAKIVDKNIVVSKTDRHTYEAFDTEKMEGVYTYSSECFFDIPATLSADRSSIIFPEDNQITILDAATGEPKMRMLTDNERVTGASINSSGEKLAAISRENILVWDLKQGEVEPTVYPAPLIGSPFKSRLEWVDDDHLLAQGLNNRVLYRLSLGLPIWSYQMDVGDGFQNKDPLKNRMVLDKFFYFAEPGGPFSPALAVGCVQFPGPMVNDITDEVDRSSLYILTKGVPVSIELKNVAKEDQVKSWLIGKIEGNGWVYDPDAEIKFEATMGIGSSQSVVYRQMFGKGKTEVVNFRPNFSNLKLIQGERILWQSGTSTGAPPIVRGERAQTAVDRMQRPNSKFFYNVRVPEEIIDPKFARGFGVSKLGLRGIEVVSTSPPGREANPEEAAKQAIEDQKKAEEEREKELEDQEKSQSQQSGRE